VDTEAGTVAQARACGIVARYVPLPELPFGDGEFDVVVANFALNYVGRPRATLAEMRRVLRPGGRIALTLWGARRGAGQDLSRQAREAGGAVLPEYRLRLDPGEDFVRTPEGLVELLGAAGFTATETTELAWEHRTNVERSWGGVLAGIARYGLTMTPQHRETLTRIRDEFDRISAEFAAGDEKLTLPHIAMLGWASA
jgi:SAM-dependent methyltransferase